MAKPGRKINNACVPCHARKVKCDGVTTGLPCTKCRARDSVADCVPLIRKNRISKEVSASHILRQVCLKQEDLALMKKSLLAIVFHCPKIPEQCVSEERMTYDSTPVSQVASNPIHDEPDLLYLRILSDAAESRPESNALRTTASTPHYSDSNGLDNPSKHHGTSLTKFDEHDRDYLTKKGIFELPSKQYLDLLIWAYFVHVHPFYPVLDRVDFIRRYQSGQSSLLILYVVLTTASLHTRADVLSACGYASRAAAQESFFSRARLLYDLGVEDDQLVMLQASIILCEVILDHPTERDFGYWFSNAVRIANKLNLSTMVNSRHNQDQGFTQRVNLYRRIWKILHTLDIFHVSLNTKQARSIDGFHTEGEADSEIYHSSVELDGLLSTVSAEEKALPGVLHDLTILFDECLSIAKNEVQQNSSRMFQELDQWRQRLAERLGIDDHNSINMHYLSMQVLSYRFECIICRLIQRTWRQPGNRAYQDWAKKRLRAAVLDLDAIAMRVLGRGKLEDYPTFFITTITMLLALHIETALEVSESDLIRSMSRISVAQTMLVLNEGKEIPVLKRALPIFETILSKNNLRLVPAEDSVQTRSAQSTQIPGQDTSSASASASWHASEDATITQQQQADGQFLSDIDFLGFDFLNEQQFLWPLDSVN